MHARELQREVFIGEAWRSVLDLGLFVWLLSLDARSARLERVRAAR